MPAALLLPVIEPPRSRARGYAGGATLQGFMATMIGPAQAVSSATAAAVTTAPAAPAGPSHPLAGTGLTWVYQEDATKLFSDQAGTTPAAATEGEAIKRRLPAEGSLWAYQSSASTNYKHGTGAGAHGINGKPTLYVSGVNGTSLGMPTDALANAMLSGKAFDYFMVCRRVDTDNNQSICALGSNRPFTLRQYTGGAKAYGFITGYAETAEVAAFNVGVHVIHVRFDTGDNKLKLSIDGGAFVAVSQTADWAQETAALSLGQADLDIACEALSNGLYTDYAALVAALKTYYAIP